jgi:hypothetical protein
MDRPADILHRGVAQHLDVPGSRSTSTSQICVAEAGPAPCALSDTSALIGPPVRPDLSDIGERQRLEAAGVGAGRERLAVLPFDRLGADVPDRRGALFQLLDDLFGRLRHRHAGGEGDAAAAGQEGEADRAGVGDDRPHPVIGNAEHLGRHHRHRGARAADIGVALDGAP